MTKLSKVASKIISSLFNGLKSFFDANHDGHPYDAQGALLRLGIDPELASPPHPNQAFEKFFDKQTSRGSHRIQPAPGNIGMQPRYNIGK